MLYLDRLQSILNAAARIILRIPKFSHISASIRSELHWLPVRFRPEFKICLLVRNCLIGTPRLTSKNSVSLFLQALAVGTFARRVEGTSLSQERIQLGLGGAVSPFPGRSFGTPYRRKFDKLWTMLNCLRKSWKHSICWSNSNTSVDSYRKSVPHQSINILYTPFIQCISKFYCIIQLLDQNKLNIFKITYISNYIFVNSSVGVFWNMS